ncbi:hypothetical protein QJS10_CPB13g00527 [Acorus calamus]|uniref:Pentatricopeptide repeat-containing protein n=1 Tax=Acorus calamus TaxID=4465 RepID=A0AAV9DH57_ACOCL|nr:hypothetical protein QJS10_CPB13g00527 [Acorus calamus]
MAEEEDLIQKASDILTSNHPKTSLQDSLSPYSPRLTPTHIPDILTRCNPTPNPSKLLTFYHLCNSQIPLFSSHLPSLLTLLSVLLHHRHYSEAKSLLVSFIHRDRPHNHLLRALLHNHHPNFSCLLLNTSVSAYIEARGPILAARSPPTASPTAPAVVFSHMIALRVLPDTRTFNILICGYCSRSDFEKAMELLRTMRDRYGCVPDNISYNTIINGYCRRGMLDEVKELLVDMRRNGLSPNLSTYNTVLSGYCRLRRLKEAVETVRLMVRDGIQPDVWTYNVLIHGLCKAGRIDEAFELKVSKDFGCTRVVGEYGERGVRQNMVTRNIVVKGLCREGRMDAAMDTLKVMVEEGFAPDHVTYNTLIDCYCKTGDVKAAFEMMDEMVSRGIKLDTVTFNTVLHSLWNIEAGRVKLNELHESGLDGMTYNTLIHAYCKEGNLEKAFLFHNQMVENSFKPNVVTCNILMKGLCSEGMVDKAMKLFEMRVTHGKVVNAVTYNTLIGGLCKEGKLEAALELVKEME